jgi:hypothetical protein
MAPYLKSAFVFSNGLRWLSREGDRTMHISVVSMVVECYVRIGHGKL